MNYRNRVGFLGILFSVGAFQATPALAASLEGTLQNLVNAFVGKILPILALGYLGKNIFSHITGDPNAKNESIRVVVAIAVLLGIRAAWSFIEQQVR